MSGSRSPSPQRRPRAPTITIDTSAVGNPEQTSEEDPDPMQAVSNNTPTSQGQDSKTNPNARNLTTPPSGEPQAFLSVPGGQQRGRENSFDSEGDTNIATPSASSENGMRPALTRDESQVDLLNHEEALKPDPGTEEEFNVTDNKFGFSPGQLSKTVNPLNIPKAQAAFHALGGPVGLEKGLRTDLRAGLSSEERHLDGSISFEEATTPVNHVSNAKSATDGDFSYADDSTNNAQTSEDAFADRKRVYGDNRLPEKKSKNIFQLMWLAFQDKVLIVLSIAAVISLAVGIYQSLHPQNGEAPVEWIEGVAIIIAVVIVVVVGALNDWQKERQFVKLNRKKDERFIKVVRSGRVQQVSVYGILVGDVVLMEPGDMVPVDGVFLEGHNVKCDESSATGETDYRRKTPADDVYQALEKGDNTKKLDPFILSGSKVTEGYGRFLVIATGVNSFYGKTLMSLRDEGEVTPLQSKLNTLAEYIAKAGVASALLYFIVCFIEFLVHITSGRLQNENAAAKGQEFLNIFVTAVSIIVVAVPEGLPLAVTLALAFATVRMMKDNNLVRLLRSCETMGNATTVCSDKTGTLTQNRMTVVAGTVGTFSRFGDRDAVDTNQSAGQGDSNSPIQSDDVTPNELVSTMDDKVKLLLEQSIAINTTAFETDEDGKKSFVGSKTETALLDFALHYLGMDSISVERANAEIVQLIPFSSARKCMGVVVKLPSGEYRMYAKGASEIMLGWCTEIIRDPTAGLGSMALEKENMDLLKGIISAYASRSLRTISITYRDFSSWPPPGVRQDPEDATQLVPEDLLKDMTFVSVVGIQDPLRPGVADAVQDCKHAGVVVRMVTGDNVQTAKAIAASCGIYTEGGVVLEGPEFRKLSGEELDKLLPRLQVLARSSPDDKSKLVKRLKELGETVAVTGDGTNDAPALKAADVGFSMGIAGTEVAKEASAIILMDDNFASIVKALLWGRAVNDAVKKFLQFQLTVNITAVLITFVTGVASSNNNAFLTPVQLLWVNLIMDTLAALALATDPPARSMLYRMPDRKSAPLISVTMWKMIIGQAIYQIVVMLVLHWAGNSILNYDPHDETLQDERITLSFNAFVWMQIFNAFNNRRLDNRFNIFEGFHRNRFFIAVILFMVGAQVLIIFVGGRALSVTRLNADQWGISIVLGFMTIPLGVALRCIPDQLISRLVPTFLKRKTKPKLVIEDEEHGRFEWNPALQEVREELMFLRKYKGGRLNNLKYKLQHPVQAGVQAGLLPPRLSNASRSRSSTNTSAPPGPEVTEVASPNRPSTPLSPPTTAHTNRATTPDSRSGKRGRSRSHGAFGPAAVAAGIVAGSIAGWSPVDKTQHPDSFHRAVSHSRSRSDLGKPPQEADENSDQKQ